MYECPRNIWKLCNALIWMRVFRLMRCEHKMRLCFFKYLSHTHAHTTSNWNGYTGIVLFCVFSLDQIFVRSHVVDGIVLDLDFGFIRYRCRCCFTLVVATFIVIVVIHGFILPIWTRNERIHLNRRHCRCRRCFHSSISSTLHGIQNTDKKYL